MACPRFLEFGFCALHDGDLQACTLVHGSKRVFYKTKLCTKFAQDHDRNACAFSHSTLECDMSRYLLSIYLDALREAHVKGQLMTWHHNQRRSAMSVVRRTFVDIAQQTESIRQRQLSSPPPPPHVVFSTQQTPPSTRINVDAIVVPRHLYETPPAPNRPTSMWGDRFFTLSA